VQIRDLVVIKKDGARSPFDREKLLKSLRIALRKRPVDDEQIERIVNGIHRRLESMGENEVPSKYIGELVMDVLMDLDKVAYVRYASVYRNFREAKDFEDFLGKMVGGSHLDD
jgi:transcriptional repressor NrdR